jgi:phosphotransferase system enzyme I (PtsI)
MLKGIGASPGIAMGKAFLIKEGNITVERKEIQDVEKEKNRFSDTLQIAEKQMNDIILKVSGEQKNIMEAHKMILQDPELIDNVTKKITNEKMNVEAAVEDVLNLFISIFDNMEDAYMKERASDIRDVKKRLLSILFGINTESLIHHDEPIIMIAHDLAPSDTAQMDKEKVLGFITDIGGRTSHSAIMARTMEIPAVVGTKDITQNVKDGDFIVMDGKDGTIWINPDEDSVQKYQILKEQEIEQKNRLKELINSETVTKDGRKVEIGCNIGNPKDARKAMENGAEGIGLYRTEFLYMDRTSMPTEEEQFQAYKEVLEIMGDRPVVIRTLDIGGDKELPYLNLPKEMNPFLGYRAIRICLDQKDLFKVQLRALLRASIYGNLKIMYPMISTIEEIKSANAVLKEVEEELLKEGQAVSSNFEVGIMIETPAAAMIADILAKEVDFFSIGTNDLIQYTIAVDRMNEKISYLYNPLNPSVLRLIHRVIQSGHDAGIWVGMCGEAAGDPMLIPILLGMGLDEFSMSAGAVLHARKQIKGLPYEQMKDLANQVLTMGDAEKIKTFIEKIHE